MEIAACGGNGKKKPFYTTPLGSRAVHEIVIHESPQVHHPLMRFGRRPLVTRRRVKQPTLG